MQHPMGTREQRVADMEAPQSHEGHSVTPAMAPRHSGNDARAVERADNTLTSQTAHADEANSAVVRPPLADLLHAGPAAWIVLLLSLVVTVIAWHLSASFAEDRAHDRFDFHVEDAQFAIQQRMTAYEQILRGGVALFQASDTVDRAAWHRYITGLNLEKNYPGILGVGYAKRIKRDELGAFTDAVRSEGFPGFTVHPAGAREEYMPVLYLEPFTPRNQRAFGFDMYSEPVREAAMARARDTGEAAVSGKVLLRQETEQDIQNGFLMYLPWYASSADSVETRRVQLLGFVYSPFRIGDLMRGILGHGLPAIEFSIYDGENVSDDSLLYDSDTADIAAAAPAARPRFTKYTKLQMGGHTWTIRYRSSPTFEVDSRSSQPLVVAISGIIIDLLLFYIIMSLARTRQRAVALADERMATLRAREIQFKAITDSAHDGILAMDSAGVVTYANPSAQALFGCSEAALIGKPLTALVSSQYAARLQEMLQEDATEKKSTPWEVEALRQNGEIFPAELSLARWASDSALNTTAVIRDIADRKKIERLQNEFVSTVSHELRTPLTAIRGSLGLIGGAFRDGLDVRRRQLVAIANANVERLSRLINDILDIDGMESGSHRFRFGEYEIQPLIEQSLEINAALAEQAQVKLVLDRVDAAIVRVDADRFIQIMTNLLSNAIKFSPPDSEVRVSARQTDRYVCVEIHDQGPGIPEAFRPRLFEKFAQADASTSRQQGGTGLGLSICKAIVERFGGKIGYESTAAVGTTFYFEIPAVPATAQFPS